MHNLGWQLLRVLLALLLLSTAVLKLLDSAQVIATGGLLGTQLKLSLAIGCEVFAALLIAVAPAQIAHRFGLLFFSGLTCIAAWAWWTQADCGCFGAQTPSGVPLILDMVALAMLIAVRPPVPRGEETNVATTRPIWLPPLALAMTMGLLATGLTNWRIASSGAGENEMPAWFGDNLIGLKLPLLRDERLVTIIPAAGKCLLVMLRPDCEHCREVAEHWHAGGAKNIDQLAIVSVAIEDGLWTTMPNVVSAKPLDVDGAIIVNWAKGDEPFVAAPTIIAIRDQMVVGVSSGDEATTLLQDPNGLQGLFATPEHPILRGP